MIYFDCVIAGWAIGWTVGIFLSRNDWANGWKARGSYEAERKRVPGGESEPAGGTSDHR